MKKKQIQVPGLSFLELCAEIEGENPEKKEKGINLRYKKRHRVSHRYLASEANLTQISCHLPNYLFWVNKTRQVVLVDLIANTLLSIPVSTSHQPKVSKWIITHIIFNSVCCLYYTLYFFIYLCGSTSVTQFSIRFFFILL